MLILMLVGCGLGDAMGITGRQRTWTTQDMRQGTATEEEIEAWKTWALEHSKDYSRIGGRYNLTYLIRGRFVSAPNDIDLQTIERFIFRHGMFFGGIGLVLDRMHGRVYYNPRLAMVDRLNSIPFSAEFMESDLNKLIQTIEESGLFNWQEYYAGEFEEGLDGGSSWVVGILFSDGSILRRGGSGDNRNYLPPEDEFAVLTNFIRTLGAEIIERHNLEN